MDTRSGIVMKIENNIAFMMTCDGEFIKVKIDKKNTFPMIGAEYSGALLKNSFIKNNIFKYASAACLTILILLGGGGAYAYYKPVSTITVDINPSIELKSNIWNKVIDVAPLNADGKKLIQEISLKNKSVDDALVLVLNQAQKDKFIDANYINNNKTVTISVKGKELNFSSFEKETDKDDFNIKIDNNGTTTFSKSSKHGNKISPNKLNDGIDKSDNHNDEIINQDNTNNVIPSGENILNKDINKDSNSDSNSNNSSYHNTNHDDSTNTNSKSNNKKDEEKDSTNLDYNSNTDDHHSNGDDHETTDGDYNHSKDKDKKHKDN